MILEKSRVSKQHIMAGLRKLGLKRGDILGVHSSLSSLGHVVGGADAVIDALLGVIEKEGTLVMPTFSTNRISVDLTPEMKAANVSWLLKILPYDPKRTPCWTGSIPEALRQREGALRSLHPFHSLTAIGPESKAVVQAGHDSALAGWKKVLELGGHILLIGVGLERCTAMHLAEERVTLPRHIQEKVTPPKWFLEKYSPSEWDWDFGPYPDFAKMEEPCLKRGIMKATRVGEATLRLTRLKELVDLYVQCLEKYPDLFYH